MSSYFSRVCGHIPQAAVSRCSMKYVFLKITQNSQEDTCAGISLLIKLQAPSVQLY